MTRLSDALKRAAEIGDSPAPRTMEEPAAPEWQFTPADAMPDTNPLDGVPVIPPTDHFDLQTSAPTASEPRTPRPATVRVGDADRNKLVVTQGLDPALVEQYRHLAAVLHHAQERSAMRSVMVTSAVPNEGKTLTATNLALTLSESYQRRVLLVDADLRRPRMGEMFGLPPGEGLINVLVNPAAGRLPVHQVSPTLSVLTSGQVVNDPMSLLVSPAMKQLLDEARANFDWVVVDTPPIAILPDANLLSAMIDTALLVVSAQSTPYPLVQRAAEAIGPGRILGVVLNRAEHAVVPVYHYGYPGTTPTHRQRPSRSWWPWRRAGGAVPADAAASNSAAGR